MFFWSEEQARAHRREHGGPPGMYLTIAQAVLLTRAMQSAMFEFPRCATR